ncbi:helix-hairpin-helix domain-containing protein [Actinokineospora guangxiensis]|uniref:Helix-hairpin-helix domain-containing protein n=1 Tax=Actinokineospora guangxiensis TaxID=1490288 RepID=A0ABW0EJB5_9PSEU
MKTKTTVDEALARLGRAIDRPWDNGTLPSYADREPPLARFLNRWTKPADQHSGGRPEYTRVTTPSPAPSPTPSPTRRPERDSSAFTGVLPDVRPTRRSIAPAALSGTAQARAAVAAHSPDATDTSPDLVPAYPTRDPDALGQPEPPAGEPSSRSRHSSSTSVPTDRFPALTAADLGLPSPGNTHHPRTPHPFDGDRLDHLDPAPSHIPATSTSRDWAPGDRTSRDPEFDLDPESDMDAPQPQRPRTPFARVPRLAAIVAVVAGALLAGLLLLPGKPTAAEPPASAPPAVEQPARTITVDIQGKVAKPGVRDLPAGSRVIDAIEAAGGALRGANTSSLNLARPLADGEQIHVGTPPPDADPAAPPRTNLNTAPVHQLDALPGVGIVTAQRIVEFRNRNGTFTSVDQLREIEGIGPSRFAKLKDLVTVH